MNLIELKNVKLEYELYHDRSHTFKEFVINLVHRRKYVEKRKNKFIALNNISLKLTEGERLGIIGGNGAGKSTLLKVIAGILKPQQGVVSVNGLIQPLIEIGAGFNPEISGRDNIYLNSFMLGFSPKQVNEKLQEIIEFSGLEQFIDVPVKYYSSGMSVRLAFTIATLIDPEILLFDEMLSAGDAEFIEKAKARIENLIQRARAMIIVSHDLLLIESLCTHVLVLKHGQIIFSGQPKECIDFYKTKYPSI